MCDVLAACDLFVLVCSDSYTVVRGTIDAAEVADDARKGANSGDSDAAVSGVSDYLTVSYLLESASSDLVVTAGPEAVAGNSMVVGACDSVTVSVTVAGCILDAAGGGESPKTRRRMGW